MLDVALHTLDGDLAHRTQDVGCIIHTIHLESAPNLMLASVEIAAHVGLESIEVELPVLGSLVCRGVNLAAVAVQVGLRHRRVTL